MKQLENTNREFNNFKMVDVVKYIAAIMVICIHCNPIVPQEQINFFIKNVICRIAVPFFFISSAFFVRRGCNSKDNYLKNYLKSLTKSYLAWSIVFIPIGLDWIHQNLTLSGELLPFALIFGLLHVGTYYHLWYIPAMIFSLFFVDKLLKHISYKAVFIISILLFMFGSLETYYGFLTPGLLKDIFDTFIQIFFTSRTGLLFGMIFITVGFYIYDYQDKLKSLIKYIPLLTCLFAIALFIEGAFLYNSARLDMNFMFMLIPFSFFFFLWVLSVPKTIKFDTKRIRELSKYYYFVHPVCIVIVEEAGKAFQVGILYSGIISFLLVFLLTHFLCSLIIKIQQQPWNYTKMIFSVILGIFTTFVVTSLFYNFKFTSIQVKFELVPCLLFISSFIIYFLLLKRKKHITTG